MANIPYLITQNNSKWKDCTIAPSRRAEVMLTANRLIAPAAKAQYIALQQTTGVPWWVIAVIHEREASQDFRRSLAQGDLWNHVSVNVPRGRGPFKSFFAAGVDSLVKCPPFASRWKDWSAGGALTLTELYNGTGYEDHHHEASPYVWGATNHEEWGKYVSDGDWSARVWDTQLGCAAMIKGMMELDNSIQLGASDIPVAQPAHDKVWIQQQLNKAGSYGLTTDGIIGTKTFMAIKDFQKKHNLDVNGVAGDSTIKVLEGV